MIKAFYVVYNTLGFGFLEKVYENALVHELGKTQLAVKQQERVDVRYEEFLLGNTLRMLSWRILFSWN